jgi:transposase-like protein
MSQALVSPIRTVSETGEPTETEEHLLQALAERLVAETQQRGAQLTGPTGLLTVLTSRVLETALLAEMKAHLELEAENVRNGFTTKTVLTGIGEVRVKVPRDRAGTFDPAVVPKHARRLSTFDEAVISLYAKGMTTTDITRHLADTYGCTVSRELVSKVTDSVLADFGRWQARKLVASYRVISLHTVMLKVRDTQVERRPFHLVVGIQQGDDREILGLWPRQRTDTPEAHWMRIFAALKQRGTTNIDIVCFDGLTGVVEGLEEHFPGTATDTGVQKLFRLSMKYVLGNDRARILDCIGDLVRAGSPREGEAILAQFLALWGPRYPVVAKICERSWADLQYTYRWPAEVRRSVCCAVQIDALQSRFRESIRRRGHFPNEKAALKVLYLTIKEALDDLTATAGEATTRSRDTWSR